MSLKTSINNIVARAVLTVLNTATKCQAASLTLIGGEKKENIEHVEPYGFTSAAKEGAEAVVLFPSGDRSHGVVIAVADRRYRLKGLKAGEVALYTDEGDSVVLKRGRAMELTTLQLTVNATEKVIFNTKDLEFNATTKTTFNTPLIDASGDVTATGEVSDVVGAMSAMRTTYNGHTHHVNSENAESNQASQPMGGA